MYWYDPRDWDWVHSRVGGVECREDGVPPVWV